MTSRLFAGIEIAARIERAEAGLIADGAAAARRRDPSLGVFCEELGGGVAAWVGAGSPLCKVAGLGFARVPDAALWQRDWERVEAAFAARDAAVRVELSTLGDPQIARTLTRRGYTLLGFENVLALALGPQHDAPALAPGIEVARCAPEALDAWLEVVVDGFAVPDGAGVASDESFPREVLEQAMVDLCASPAFVRCLATRDGVTAGGAGMRLSGGIAQFCGAATLPAHRRRGVQGALLAVRLAQAREAGCDLAVVTTQPGSTSQQNVQRLGFELLYARAVLVRT